MLNTLLLRLATETEWNPEPGFTPDPNSVTPGVLGFTVMALVAAAVFFLGWDLNRRVRRIQFREEAQAKIAAEQAAAEQQRADAAPSSESGQQQSESEHNQ